MKKKIVICIVVLISILLVTFISFKIYNYLRIKYAKIEVVLKDDLTLEFNDSKKVSDYIKSINGKITNDYEIDSTKLGKKTVKFEFINDDNIKLDYSYEIEVKDTVKPVIWLNNTYSVAVNSEDTLLDKILCGDNYDSNPTCEIVGEYDLNTVGVYPLTFKATDNSGNTNEKEFNLNVYTPVKSNTKTTPTYTYFKDVVSKYKSKNTSIGIDVSKWQGDIDFEKLKDAGVEFIIIRVGSMDKTTNEYYLDSKFKQNIEKANEYGIDVGLYFFSYSKSNKEAIKEAKWVLKQIKGYKVKLPITYDFEDFSNFNSYNLSFFGLTSMAESFLDTIEKAGYKGMIYGSKKYLEQIWFDTKYDVWLAHYTINLEQTDYSGKYKIWQVCDDGITDGINGYVDIDIMYNK